MSSPYTTTAANAASSGGAVSANVLEALRGTKGWVKLVGVLLFIGAAFTVIAAVGMTVGMGMMGSQKGAMPFGVAVLIGLVYVALAAIYIFLGLYLVKCAGAIGRLLTDVQVTTLGEALQYQRKFWRLAGILVLISLVLAVLGIVAAIAIPFFAGR